MKVLKFNRHPGVVAPTRPGLGTAPIGSKGNRDLPAQSHSQVVNVQAHVQTWQTNEEIRRHALKLQPCIQVRPTQVAVFKKHHNTEPRSELLLVYIWVKGRGQCTVTMSDCHRGRVVGFLYRMAKPRT